MARVSGQFDPLLRRPFAVHSVKKASAKETKTGIISCIELLYKVVGKGTRAMSLMRKGDEMDIIGPIGNGYRLDPPVQKAILIGGGIGVASLFYLAETIITKGSKAKEVVLLLGGKTKDDILCIEDFRGIGIDVRVATEDGSLGCKGVVTDLLLDYILSEDHMAGASPYCFACGPEDMLKEVSKVVIERELACQVSLESKMACGVGACMVCGIETKPQLGDIRKGPVLKSARQKEETGYKRVCTDGPVFDCNEIIWE
ncbi:MAG: dihydroorotate dehydrogenase electron transfer subunit [Thermodesulfobacteriota bacterium]|nr:dihydroorotate dehydrogenase electron transfer subunit [Thermodesulfobacteriota bacterium]